MLTDPDLTRAVLRWHRSSGGQIDRRAYLRRYRSVLLNGLSRSRLIYLDTNYWVRLREAELGQGSSDGRELLATLRETVRSREVLCVSHLYSLVELAKQDSSSLKATAALLDELTEGVALASPDDLTEWECSCFIGQRLGLNTRDDLCAWTKAGQITENRVKAELPGPATREQKEAILKAMVDSLWSMTFNDLFAHFDWDTKGRLTMELDPAVLVAVEAIKRSALACGESREQSRLKTFSEVVRNKLRPVFERQLTRWHQERGFPDGVGLLLEQIATIQREAIEGFRMGGLGASLPISGVVAELYSLHETAENRRPSTSNDWIDANHAAAALAHCDAFFTEKHLAHQLRHELRADQRYGCRVADSIAEALEVLRA